VAIEVEHRSAAGMKTKSCGLTRRDAGRSGLTSNGSETFSIFDPVKSGKVKDCFTVVTPVSMVATIRLELPPGLMSQACGMSISWKFHW
jgi:hypothetical protein